MIKIRKVTRCRKRKGRRGIIKEMKMDEEVKKKIQELKEMQ
jgi:hypothetical protein